MRNKNKIGTLSMLLLGLLMNGSLFAQPCATPSNVTASPSTICPSGTSQLNAISTGNTIDWYTQAIGGVAIGSSASGANFAVTPSVNTTYYAEAINTGGSSGTQTFSYTGAAQTFTVPPGVTSINFDLQGAQGGIGYNLPLVTPGLGGRVQGTITTTPGEVLQINVGGQGGAGGTTVGGTAGWNGGGIGGGWSGGRSGGGGGGATDIRRGGTALSNRIIVAAGGGGTGVNHSTGDAGGNGGGLTGVAGLTGTYLGGGATQSAGGTPNGVLGIGGNGGTGQTGGGGGGGYYGGGGSAWEGGGGGSSYCTTVGATSVVHTTGFRTGNGLVVLTWTGGVPCSASSRVPVTVTIGNPVITNATATPPIICTGGASNLSAVSAGNNIDWYLVPSGGVPVGSSVSGGNYTVNPLATTTYYAEAISTSGSGTQTFSYTGGVQTFTVPNGVASLTVDIKGAQGGSGFPALVGPGGNGGRVTGTIAVTGGQVINIYVGGAGANAVSGFGGAGGYNGGGQGAVYTTSYSGGGGGGASDIRVSPYGLANRLVVAGGGGGGAYNYATAGYDRGGMGGGLTGEAGYGGNTLGGQGAGTGGSQAAGGIGGTYPSYCTATNGATGIGGAGGTCTNSGGGGGGGYYGGGGGVWGGGGGGSSFLSGGTHTQGFQTGNGSVTISWVGGSGGCSSTSRLPVTVTVDQASTAPTSVSGTPTVCPGGSTTLTQVGAVLGTAGVINWYTGSCGGALVGTGNSITVNPTSTTTYYVRAEGSCNSTTCASIVVTVDNVPPVANCQTVTVTLDAFGNGSVAAAALDGGSTDNCTVGAMSINTSTFNCSNVGPNAVILTVNDGNNNSDTCVSNVIVIPAPLQGTISSPSNTCGYNVACAGGSTGTATASGVGSCPGYTYLWSNNATTQTITGLVAGTYNVLITSSSGAIHTETIVLTEPAPIAATFTNTPSCDGATTGTIDVTATGGNDCQGYTYTWSNGGTGASITGLAPGTYTVTITDAAGCTFVASETVANLPAPNPLFTQSGNVLTSTQSWTTYQWLIGGSPIPGATSISHTATVPGVYSLQVTGPNGCVGTSAPVNVTIVGIDNAMGDWMGLSLYPNPAMAEFRLKTESPITYGMTVNIHDMFGKLLASNALSELSHEASFDIRSFAAGTYVVEVTSELGQRKVFRLVVQ
ncbi:MAG: T9SS type A sorting domain-containing protein [Bacteroidetes bacterium]|nr:T9SS type A sorting domain-containing protein [Bacteroidota bacterium]